MEQMIDWQAALDGSRPVTTRDGRKVTLYCIDAPGHWPVHGRVENHDSPCGWTHEGYFFSSAAGISLDLIQLPRRFKYEREANVTREGGLFLYSTKEDASRLALSSRIACIKIVVEGEEGEGLE